MDNETSFVMTQTPDWLPLDLDLDIEPGSALDFSSFRPTGEPAGNLGRIISTPDGHFAFEKAPKTAVRFYGVNLCHTAHYITHDQSDRLAERLARLGYNTLRVHHYERDLIAPGPDSLAFIPERIDQLDYLLFALKRRGIYLSTDLYVSRRVLASEIWPGAEGFVDMNEFKTAVHVNENAFANWKAFSRNLLTHKNPYTGLAWAEDPALAWICMLNESNLGNFADRITPRLLPDWTAAWNAWLRKSYPSREAVEKAWGIDPVGDPALGTVPLLSGPYGKDDDSPRGRDLFIFLAETDRDTFLRQKSFLRDELGAKALLTSTNGWTSRFSTEVSRLEYDFVDDHFYVDHPEFLGKEWSLPTRQLSKSYVATGTRWNAWNTASLESQYHAFVRLYGKPFTISEFNFPYPSPFRGQGGLLSGALAALQDWSALWRFCYSHARESLFEPQSSTFFDLACDPLNQASDRAVILLFLRGDLSPAPHSLAVAATTDEITRLRRRNLQAAPPWQGLGLITRVGTVVTPKPCKVPVDLLLPIAWSSPRSAWSAGQVLDADPHAKETGDAVLDLFRKNHWLSTGPIDLASRVITSETGQFTIDPPRDTLVIDTPRTSGGYVPEGRSIASSSLSIRVLSHGATIWVSSLDANPISSSSRLLLTHLTDVQCTGTRFKDSSRTTLLERGGVPHLVRIGSAEISIKSALAAKLKVWSLSTSGSRLACVPASVKDGALVIPLEVKSPEGPRMLYEIATN